MIGSARRISGREPENSFIPTVSEVFQVPEATWIGRQSVFLRVIRNSVDIAVT